MSVQQVVETALAYPDAIGLILGETFNDLTGRYIPALVRELDERGIRYTINRSPESIGVKPRLAGYHNVMVLGNGSHVLLRTERHHGTQIRGHEIGWALVDDHVSVDVASMLQSRIRKQPMETWFSSF